MIYRIYIEVKFYTVIEGVTVFASMLAKKSILRRKILVKNFIGSEKI